MSTQFTSESDPLEEMRELLDSSWKSYPEVKRPQLIVVNDVKDPRSRADLNMGDTILIRMDGIETSKQRANFKYYDRIFPMMIEIYTKESRQRMRDLGKMVRMIINDNIHNFNSYQLMRYKGQDESVEDTLNIWRYRFRLQLESNAVCAESLI